MAGTTCVVISQTRFVNTRGAGVIDRGRVGGLGGGTVVVAGTPEDVAAHPQSHTGHYLKRFL